ncbi:NAD(P)-binding protein [Whalleya microplaca]|nr:NAD(P)-binding protein [Whalleya microplaca]
MFFAIITASVVFVTFIMVEFREMLRVTLFGSRNNASSGVSFEPQRDIPSLAGKVILITGAAGDLGRQTTIELARYGRPAYIYVADLPRDEHAKTALIDRITSEAYDGKDQDDDTKTRTTVRFLDLDLTSFESVRACATELVSKTDRLDILILNAGIIRVATGLTPEGYEIHFGLNYLGHALLSRLLMPLMQSTVQSNPDVRIVVVSSEGHAVAPQDGIRFGSLKTTCSEMSYAQRYGQSKLALIGLMRELARRYPDIKSSAVHPGRILTGMADSLRKESTLARVTAPISPLFCVPVAIGIRNHLWAATSPNVVSGTYYEPVGAPVKGSTAARDENMPGALWEWTSNELKGIDSLN